jgi:hypothetical protein
MHETGISLPARLAMTLDRLGRAVAARIAGGAMMAWMIVAVWTRIRRAERDILALLARFQAGKLRAGKPGAGRLRSVGPGARPPAVALAGEAELEARRPALSGVAADARRLPRRFGWLIPLAGFDAVNYGTQLRATLEDPQMQALLACSRQARRILAPLCLMLGVERAVLQGPVLPPRVLAARKTRAQGQSDTQRPAGPAERIMLSREILAAARRDGFGKRRLSPA